MHDRFQNAAVAMHHQTSGPTDHDGGFNGYWPEAWGTSPGAAARQMSGGDGLSGVPGSSYDTSYVDPTNRADSFDDIIRAVDRGHAVPLFTYDIQNAGGRSGAHVVLVTGTDGDTLRIYEPESGRTRVVGREEFVSASLREDLGWNKPLVAVLPR